MGDAKYVVTNKVNRALTNTNRKSRATCFIGCAALLLSLPSTPLPTEYTTEMASASNKHRSFILGDYTLWVYIPSAFLTHIYGCTIHIHTYPLMRVKRSTESVNIARHHSDVVQAYNHAQRTRVPALIRERALLQSVIDNARTVPNPGTKPGTSKVGVKPKPGYTTNAVDRIQQITSELNAIERTHRNYLQRAALPVFKYYEEKQQAASGNNVADHRSVLAFFQGDVPGKTDATTELTDHTFVRRQYQKYWTEMGGPLLNASEYVFDPTVCVDCGIGEMVSQEDRGTMQCNNRACGQFVEYIADNQKSSHPDTQNEVYYTAYVRLNHFKEILTQFQANQSTTIPPEIIERIRARLVKERIPPSTLCYTSMRQILSGLELNKYFEHIQHINAIFGVVPPRMDDELYNTLCVLFVEIEEPWTRCCPPNRVNFFNYTYVLHQLLVLLDQHKYLPFLAMSTDREMKDRTKQMEQDNVWKLVCKELDWLYCPVS